MLPRGCGGQFDFASGCRVVAAREIPLRALHVAAGCFRDVLQKMMMTQDGHV